MSRHCKGCGKSIGYRKLIDGVSHKISRRSYCLDCKPIQPNKDKRQSESVTRCIRRKKQRAIDYLGGKCVICGYSKCAAALCCHHLNDKTHHAAYVIHSRSWEFAKKELDKCILVCANCHAEIHHGMHKVEDILPHYERPVLSKICTVCTKEFFTKEGSQKFCSPACFRLSEQKTSSRPSKEQLYLDIKENNWVALGRKYGVSDNAVRKWARSYELETDRRKYLNQKKGEHDDV